VTAIDRWLDARQPPPPPSLFAALVDAVAAADPPDGPVSHRLALTGLRLLERVAGSPSTRAHALDLLTADALLTYACEAALEEPGGEGAGRDPVDLLLETLASRTFAHMFETGTAQ
jgi:hypothetical protein